MRRNTAPLAMFLLFLTLTGLSTQCSSGPDVVWPAVDLPVVTYWYVPPEPPMPVEQAIGTAKNLQAQFLTWSGNGISAMDIDAYGLRIRATWTEVQSGTRYVPQSGGYWVGSQYIPYSGGSYQPWQQQQQREETVIIPFDKVELAGIAHDRRLRGNTQFVATFWLLNSQPVEFRFAERATAQEFANAIAALAAARGRNIAPKGRIGASVAALTAAQSQDLAEAKLSPGILVQRVTRGGPAQEAGLRAGDVLLKANGIRITSEQQYTNVIDTSGPQMRMQIARRGAVPDGKGGTVPGWVQLELTMTRWGM